MVIAWVNSEVGSIGATTLPMPFEIENEPSEQQWAELARIVASTCFESGGEAE